MKYVFGLLLLWNSLLFGLDGAEVFKAKCASCHDYYIPQRQLFENYKTFHNEKLKLKAPTLTELSFRLKDQVGDRTTDAEGQTFEIEEYLAEFLKDPKAKKSILPKYVRSVYPDMPPVETTEDEQEALAKYMYEYAEKMMVMHGVKRHSFEEALKIAKEEGKIIMIEGYLPFCRGCIWMDRNVMVEPEVKAALNRDFVLVKTNLLTEKLPLGMKRLGTPSFYFIAPDGKTIIDMMEGTGKAEEFLALLADIKSRTAGK